MYGNTAVVEALLKAGADVDKITCVISQDKDKDSGFTALHLAVKGGHLETAEMLLRSGANVNALTSKWNYSPICLAAKNGYYKVVKLLLKCNKVDLNIATKNFGNTALQRAVEKGHIKVVQLLLKAGANITPETMCYAQKYCELCGGDVRKRILKLVNLGIKKRNLEASKIITRAAKRQKK